MLQKKNKAHLDSGQLPENLKTPVLLWCQIVMLCFHLPLQFLLFFISPDFSLWAFDLFSIVIIQAFHARTFQVGVIQP